MQEFTSVTLGTNDRRLKNDRFSLTETAHRPNLSLDRHSHRHASIAFVLRGSFIEQIRGRKYECRPRTLLIKPAGESHLNSYNVSGARTLLVEVFPEMNSLFPIITEILSQVEFVTDGEMLLTADRLYREFKIGDSASEVAAEGLTLELLSAISRKRNSRTDSGVPRWLQLALEYIHSNFRETIALAEIASAVDIDPSHLARTFREKHSCTIGEYIRRLRVGFAADQLVSSDKSIAEISVSCGFYDQSHLTRTFKEQLGVTPARYRSLRG